MLIDEGAMQITCTAPSLQLRQKTAIDKTRRSILWMRALLGPASVVQWCASVTSAQTSWPSLIFVTIFMTSASSLGVAHQGMSQSFSPSAETTSSHAASFGISGSCSK